MYRSEARGKRLGNHLHHRAILTRRLIHAASAPASNAVSGPDQYAVSSGSPAQSAFGDGRNPFLGGYGSGVACFRIPIPFSEIC